MQKLHRGYYNDAESGLYYLQSRYYDPEIGRFINADSLTSTGQGFLGNNMFAYCGNNPVNYRDTNGLSPEAILIDGVIAGVVSLINAAAFGAKGGELIEAFASGFLQGVVCSATAGFGFGSIIKYAIILYDVGSAVYECWESGASTKECALVAFVQLYAAFSFDSLDTDQVFDLVFGLGTTLWASAVTEGVKQKNLTNASTLPVPDQQSDSQPGSIPGYSGGKIGYGSMAACCMI